MLRRASAALAPLILFAANAAANAEPLSLQSEPVARNWRLPIDEEPGTYKPGLSLPTIDYVAPSGGIETKRGIVAGVEVAPNATLGIGLFKILPKERRLPGTEDPFERKPKSRKSAAVGLAVSF